MDTSLCHSSNAAVLSHACPTREVGAPIPAAAENNEESAAAGKLPCAAATLGCIGGFGVPVA